MNSGAQSVKLVTFYEERSESGLTCRILDPNKMISM